MPAGHKVVRGMDGNGRIPPFSGRNPSNRYVNPYYWVDEFVPYYMERMGV